MKIAINTINHQLKDYDYIIGVEKGALANCNFAIADFDSVTKEELELIKKKKHKVLPEAKDETDVEAAIIYAKSHNPTRIDVHLPMDANRIDHILTNILLVNKYGVNLVFDDAIITYCDGELEVEQCEVLSIYNFEDTNISIKGSKYDLDRKVKKLEPLMISNSVDKKAVIKSSNRVIVFIKK